MDTTTANLFKMIDAQKALPRNNGKSFQSAQKKTPRQQFNLKSRFKVMQEKLQALEWNPELPDTKRALIPKGWRGATLRWIGFNLRRLQVDREIIEKIIRQAANEICLPPITENNIDYLIKGIFKNDLQEPEIKTAESTVE